MTKENKKDTAWGNEPYGQGRSLLRLRSDEQFVREIEKEAKLLGLNVSEFVRMAIRNYINQVHAIREKAKKRIK